MSEIKRLSHEPDVVLEKNKDIIDFIILEGKRYSKFDLLAAAEDANDMDITNSFLRIASLIFHPQDDGTFNTLYGAVRMSKAWEFQEDEFTIHHHFFETACDVIEDAKRLVPIPTNRFHRPDAMIEVKKGFQVPVEIKRKKFDNKALQQLLRYMNYFESNRGIAIAEELSTTLPDNVTFFEAKLFKPNS